MSKRSKYCTKTSQVAPLALLIAVAGCGTSSSNNQFSDQTQAELTRTLSSRGGDAGGVSAGNATNGTARDPLTHASALVAAGEIDEGMSEAKIALALNRNDLKLSLEVGRMAMRTGRLADALDIYQEIAEHFPNSPEALNGEGVVMAQKGDLDAAADLLKKALALRSNDVPIRNNLALVLLLRGDASGAKSILEPIKGANAPPEIKAALAAAAKEGAQPTPPAPAAQAPKPAAKADNAKAAATPLAASRPVTATPALADSSDTATAQPSTPASDIDMAGTDIPGTEVSKAVDQVAKSKVTAPPPEPAHTMPAFAAAGAVTLAFIQPAGTEVAKPLAVTDGPTATATSLAAADPASKQADTPVPGPDSRVAIAQATATRLAASGPEHLMPIPTSAGTDPLARSPSSPNSRDTIGASFKQASL